MNNPTTTPITDTSSTQSSPASINESKDITEQTTITPVTTVGEDKNTDTTSNDVVTGNKGIKAV
jgi:hypothetical protein